MIPLWTALMMGLFGSFHCAGMCGPIAFALPLGNKSILDKTFRGLAYNLGRVFTYASLGAIVGLFGSGIKMAGFQQWISITVGILFVLTAILPAAVTYKYNPVKAGLFTGKLKKSLRSLFGSRRLGSLVSIGLINGLLPCGLVYAALGGALTLGSAGEGILFMVFFGLGTLPVMLSMTLIANRLGSRVRSTMRKAVPVFIFIMGFIFILRGMNLDIPYLSPDIEPKVGNVESCH